MKLTAYLIIIASSSIFYLGSSEVSAGMGPSADEILDYLRNKTTAGKKCSKIWFKRTEKDGNLDTEYVWFQCPVTKKCDDSSYKNGDPTFMPTGIIMDEAMENNSDIDISDCGILMFK